MKVPLLIAAGAAGVLLAVWLLAGRKAEAPPRPTIETAAAPAAPAATEHVELGATDASDRTTAVPAPEAKATRGVLEVAFKDLANGDVRPKSGRLFLHREGSAATQHEIRGSDPVRISELDAGRYEVRVRAEGYDEGISTVDVSGATSCEVCLMPQNWVGVVVRDANDRSIAEWSLGWGGEPKHFFRGSFRVFLADTPGEAPTGGQAKLAGQVEAAGTGCTPAGCIGFVTREPGAPVWIGLECLGNFYGWQLANPGARSVTFVIDPSTISARFAEIRMRVLHEETRLPALEAKIALLSDSSKHRRKEQQQVALDRDGSVVLSRLMPEDYELRIELQAPDVSSEVVQRLVLAPGEHRDLGDILVRSAPPIRVRVVDEQGNDVQDAAVQVGPLVPGTDEDTTYSIHGQPRYWNRDRNGVIAVPQPAFRAVMRALRMQELRPGVQIHNTGRSSNTLAANGTLVIRNPVQVELSSEPSLALTAAEIRDELGIVVAKAKLDSFAPWRVALVRGVYEASAHDERGNVLARLSFTVESEPVSIDFR
jgi:hypothetical protein